MQPQKILLSDVKIHSRMRKDLGDLTGLQDSIRRHGVIQPIVLSPDNTLIAGERRYRSCEQLGLVDIPFIYSTEMPEDVKVELEFEENYWRKAMSWQEECLGILNIYEKKKMRGALDGFSEDWTRTTSEMFGMSTGTINYILRVAKKLRDEKTLPEDKRRYHKFSSANEAYRLGLLADEADKYTALLAEAAKKSTQTNKPKNIEIFEIEETRRVVELQAKPELLQSERERYESNSLNTIPFDEYWAKRQADLEERKNTVYLGNVIIHGDSIEFMMHEDNLARFDHIITDIPYGIDMDMLNQQNQHGGMTDINRVEDAHDAVENMSLMQRFFPAAFRCTKERAFVITCCDIMQWQYMYDLAIGAGFAVQRWPYLWRKVNQSVMNNCAGYNTTKDFEPVMICRKPGSTLFEKRNTSFTDASNNEATKLTGHPFAKPFELTRDLVKMVSMEGQTILEPFAGGGSMAIQMLRMKRNAVAVEKETHHYNQLLENVKNHYYLKLNPKFIFQ